MNVKHFILFTFIAFIFTSCYYDKEEELYPQYGNTCDTTNVTYSKSIAPVISDNCTSCHYAKSANGGNINLENYSDVINNLDKVMGSINHKSGYKAMPQNSGQLSTCNLRNFQIWFDAGAKNN